MLEARIVRSQARLALRDRRFGQAEELTQEAGELFAEAGEAVWAAAARAELAGLYALLGREEDVHGPAGEAADFFESQPLHREAARVVQILRTLPMEMHLDDLLEDFHGHLDAIVHDMPRPGRGGGEVE